MTRIVFGFVLIFVGAMPAYATQIEVSKLSVEEMIEVLKGDKRREAAQECSGKLCCCAVPRRSVLCTRRWKCKELGARCTTKKRCPR